MLREKGNQVRVDDVVGGELKENAHRATLEAVSCQHLRFWERLQKLEESSISHLLEERRLSSLLVEEAQHMSQHFRILILLNYCPPRDAEGIRASCLGLIPLNDDLVLRRIVVDDALLGEMLEVVEARRCLVHEINHHRENWRVELQSLSNQEDDLLTRCWGRLLRGMKGSRCCQRRDEDVQKRRLNCHSSSDRSQGLGVRVLGRRNRVLLGHNEACHLRSQWVILHTGRTDDVILKASPQQLVVVQRFRSPNLLDSRSDRDQGRRQTRTTA